jgi:hypothetical protein
MATNFDVHRLVYADREVMSAIRILNRDVRNVPKRAMQVLVDLAQRCPGEIERRLACLAAPVHTDHE